ncbi:MAG TPA: hypothetical protein VFO85_00105 [Vicinamibacteria bacterium]|nr:hypothetical protein [Vicinamibacteria bacterium]
MTAELLKLVAFLAFLGLGWRLRRRRGPARQAAVRHFVGFVVALSLMVGVAQRDAWPFTSHTIAVGRARAGSRVCQTEFSGLDAQGRAWRLDPYTFTPVFDSILQYWVEQALPRLDEAQRGRVLSFLLARAEASRRRLAAGAALGPGRVLGAAGAPYWLLLPRHPAVPPAPYAGLRIEQACWTPAERATAGEAAVGRRPLAQWPASAAP